MSRSLDSLYARFGLAIRARPWTPRRHPCRRETDREEPRRDAIFRAELARLADEMDQMKAAHEGSLEFGARAEAQGQQDGAAWIAKLQGDVGERVQEGRGSAR